MPPPAFSVHLTSSFRRYARIVSPFFQRRNSADVEHDARDSSRCSPLQILEVLHKGTVRAAGTKKLLA
jgi:hypothetical protein